ncbi:alpha/beta hydrolase [Ferrovibrio sp.]|uniref:alpha/beta hydrolase n=1 Tax=Ferrovibrio sp. TaxID=1917215 RepID=UPI003D0BCE05
MTRSNHRKNPLSKLSTNVWQYLSLATLRLGYRLGFTFAPGYAAERAARIFLTPQRRAPAHLPEPQGGATPFELEFHGGELHAWSWGPHNLQAVPTVLVVHGWEDDHRGMTPLVDRLTWSGFRVVALDLPGHGRSDGRLAPIPQLAEAVAAVARLIGPLEAIVAHSLGGTAAMIAMTELGVVAQRAVILASPNHPEHFARGIAGFIGLNEAGFQRMRLAIERLAGRPMQALHLPPLLRRLNLPALFVHDRADRVVPLQHSRDNVDAWRGARLEIVEGMGHRRILSDPAVIERVRAFVAGETAKAELFSMAKPTRYAARA